MQDQEHQSTSGLNVIWIMTFTYELWCQLWPLGRDLGRMMQFSFGPTTLCGMLHRNWFEFVSFIFGSLWFPYFLSVAGLNLPSSFPRQLLPLHTWLVLTLFIKTCVCVCVCDDPSSSSTGKAEVWIEPGLWNPQH